VSQKTPAVLVLADGSIFRGLRIGAEGQTVGEVVFNTAMTGYQEILTDPSYAGQIVTLTYPHIGNTGANAEDVESRKLYARASSSATCHGRVQLAPHGGPAAVPAPQSHRRHRRHRHARLTRLLRSKGAQNGSIVAGPDALSRTDEAWPPPRPHPPWRDRTWQRSLARPGRIRGTKASGRWARGYKPATDARFHVVAFDYGIKHNILRNLAERGCKVTVLPATATARDALALKPDGVFLSNGPGDPEPCDYAIKAIREIVGQTHAGASAICIGTSAGLGRGREDDEDDSATTARTTRSRTSHGATVVHHQQNHGSRSTNERCPGEPCRPRTARSSTARCRGSSSPTARRTASRAIPRPRPGPREMSVLLRQVSSR
jgi:carbamoyl-phosphate synthase small subunit